MKEFKGTPGPWVVDVRGGCVAVYADGEQDETPGCHCDDLRNIAYSNKGAEYDKVVGYWSMDKDTIHNYRLISAAPELLESLQEMVAAMQTTLRVGYDRIIELGGSCDSVDVMIKNQPEISRSKAIIAKALGEQ